jgi:hypothetical protein
MSFFLMKYIYTNVKKLPGKRNCSVVLFALVILFHQTIRCFITSDCLGRITAQKIGTKNYGLSKSSCAANFSFAELAKRESLGRSKLASNSQAQAPQHTVWNVSTISKPY